MKHYALPSQYDCLMDELRYHLANVSDGRIVVVSYIMPCDAVMGMVAEAADNGVPTLVAVDAQHAKPGAVPIRCHGSEAMHAKYIVAGDTCIVGSWNFGNRGSIVFIEESDWDLAQELAHEADNLVQHTKFTEQLDAEITARLPGLRGRFGTSIRRQFARRGTLSGPQIAAVLNVRE